MIKLILNSLIQLKNNYLNKFNSTFHLFNLNVIYLIISSTVLMSIQNIIISLFIYLPLFMILIPLLLCIKGIICKNWYYLISIIFIPIGILIYVYDWFSYEKINESKFFDNYYFYSSLIIFGIIIISDLLIFFKVYITIIIGLFINISFVFN